MAAHRGGDRHRLPTASGTTSARWCPGRWSRRCWSRSWRPTRPCFGECWTRFMRRRWDESGGMRRTPDLEDALRIARVLMDTTGMDAESAAVNPAIPEALRPSVLARLEAERVIHIRDPNMVEDINRPH